MIREYRLKKMEILRSAGIDPYPARASFATTNVAGIKINFKKYFKSKKAVGVSGRITGKREHGGSVFLDIFGGAENLPAGPLRQSLSEASKAGIQVFVTKSKLGEKSFSLFSETADIGDFIAVSGKAFYTKRKEPTIEADRWEILAKSFLPLPEKWHGLQDVEERFRKRYLDILMNPDVRKRFLLRSRLIADLRLILDGIGYIEVETPVLQPIYGGALAEPFKTRHRMLGMDMYLRIAPELYLKRLLAAGFNKIFEIGRNFRNEGLDATHNPEFTTIELYEAYRDAEYLRNFIAKILEALIKKLLGKNVFKFGGDTIKFTKKIPTIKFWQLLERYAAMSGAVKFNRDDFVLRAKQFGISVRNEETKENIADAIFKKICRPKLIQPVYVIDYPVEMSPLAKNLAGSQTMADRFQLIAGGMELVNGFSELNDPIEQRQRLEAQELLRKEENKEAHPMDEEFIEMLEYGMPPAAGLAISIDRLTMLLTDAHNIKEVILFPTMRPR
ncbi:lysine--tRNA ligase [Candidatus Giovannonibacteria bacterium RIFCSPLOWO2_01_FULL_44_40]|uniref:Lysine--tRNA ligase n=1 Tax=Candidatus Giovannonibacteria bacterium RIFCSPHIGHO2_01_FULL_45_23 TaxID=1798325 RepID=A0A1F5VIU8_9BACT|nr:MAG: lysine--tRNA ligase [Candidatus Giovannonibacteria bacterium RIFCSPHIGHO2_01_FULL_45_23]OGF75798.1 MAG: lysine--tRNA ligase [Candidatus Giovannonibacteria bacterium RIFCSPHIGHO2_02_FULL_45_13]OGF80312.1 MAG: lysine--tRNA ligase [Candidatus Giovannonibacteria bacterium RIFCSPLOWO2_01_FULL_44_40]